MGIYTIVISICTVGLATTLAVMSSLEKKAAKQKIKR